MNQAVPVELRAADETDGRITDERVALMQSLIGIRRAVAGWNRTVTQEGVQRFARGIGDDNPLWWDEDYAVRSPMGGPIAPPCYLYSHANDMLDNASPGSGPFANHLPGVLALWTEERWRWLRPVRVGEVIGCEQSIAEVRVDTGKRFADVSLTQVELEEFRTAEGELVAEHWQTFKRFEKRTIKRVPSDQGRTETVYTAQDRERFEAHYRDERRRGDEPRFIQDVTVDDPIDRMLKGPLTLGNMIGFMLGWGSSLAGTNRILSRQLAAFPQASVINPQSGVRDGMTAYHWEPALAREAGLPGGYDFGCQRSAWISHHLTDWAGDHGFLSELNMQLRRPNILNDVSWITGRIAAIDIEQATVTIAVSVVNQRDEESARATGKVRLPRRAA